MAQIVLAGFDVDSPIAAPKVSAGKTTGGIMPGMYEYGVTYVTNYGETHLSPMSQPTSITSSAWLYDIPVSANHEVATKKIYRKTGTQRPKEIAVIKNNVMVFEDVKSNGQLGTEAPIGNTASSSQIFRGRVSFSNPIARSFKRITAGGNNLETAAHIDCEHVCCDVPNDRNGVALPAITAHQIGVFILVRNMSSTNRLSIYPARSNATIEKYSIPYLLGPEQAITLSACDEHSWDVISSIVKPSDIVGASMISAPGQILTAGDDNSAGWKNPQVVVSSGSTISTSSTSTIDIPVDSMQAIVPEDGVYMISWFTTVYHDADNQTGTLSLYTGDNPIVGSEISVGGSIGVNCQIPASSCFTGTYSAGDTLTVRWRITAGTIFSGSRKITLIKLIV